MRRDYFSVEIRDTEWGTGDGDPQQPRLRLMFDGPTAALDDRLVDGREDLDADSVDVAYRLLDSTDVPDATGVIAVTDRLTGDFLLEANADADDVLEFVRAAREYGKTTDGDDRYQVELYHDGEELYRYDKSTFLVYSDEGDLVRRHSLIPSGIEL